MVEGTVGGKTVAIQDVVFDFPQKSANVLNVSLSTETGSCARIQSGKVSGGGFLFKLQNAGGQVQPATFAVLDDAKLRSGIDQNLGSRPR